MWNRGENAEAIKWVRRAAEAAYEGEHDGRGLELTKAAADISAMITRQSLPDGAGEGATLIDNKPTQVSAGNPVAQSKPAPSKPQSKPAQSAPLPVAAPATAMPAASGSVSTPKAPPVSQRPPPVSKPPPPTPPPRSSVSPRPGGPAAAVGDKKPAAPKSYQGSAPSKPPVVGSARGEPRRPRKSGHAFTEEAKSQKDLLKGKRKSRPDKDEIAAKPAPAAPPIVPQPQGRTRSPSTTEEWDMFPTQNLAADELDKTAEKMRVEPNPAFAESPRVVSAPPPGVIPTSQAIRVVIWQDGNGVHVAPAGTVVSAISLEAMLVSLDPATDLAAWLASPRKA
jgi:hypothetical protein